MPQLSDKCDVWRMTGAYEGGKTMKVVFRQVPCLRVPISAFDALPEYARESTDVFLLPDYVGILKDDEVRYGRRKDITGNAVQYRYTIEGIRSFDQIGYQHVEVFARMRD